MVAPGNPFCPVSFGFFGLLSAILSRRGSLYQDAPTKKVEVKREEEEDLLAAGEAECDELTDDRISSFLENQKQQYYRSIGLAPPKQMKTLETSTTPGESMIEFPSSRETSILEEGEQSALLSLSPSPAFTPQTFRMDDQSDKDDLEPVPMNMEELAESCRSSMTNEGFNSPFQEPENLNDGVNS